MPHSHIACAMLSNSVNNGSMNSLPALVKLGANIQCSASDTTKQVELITLRKGTLVARASATNDLGKLPYCWFTYKLDNEVELVLDDNLSEYITKKYEGAANKADSRKISFNSVHKYQLTEECVFYDMSDPDTISYLARCLHPEFRNGDGLHAFPIIIRKESGEREVARKSDKEEDRKLFKAMIKNNLVDGTNIHGWAHDNMLQHSPNNKYDERNQHVREAVVVNPIEFLRSIVTHDQNGSPTRRRPIM